MKPPNFLIIGAARSGTTSLVHCLQRHPQVFFPATAREPKFFSREQEYQKGLAYYLQTYFATADNYPAVGEKSTEYLESVCVAERIYAFQPRMKLIVMLRQPVERMLSNYWWSVRNGVETRPIEEALQAELERYLRHPEPVAGIDGTRPHAYIERSLYYEYLLPFYRLFAKESIHCVLFEEFVAQQPAVTGQLLHFLAVESSLLALNAAAKERAVERPGRIAPQRYQEFCRFFREKNQGLGELTGLNIEHWWT